MTNFRVAAMLAMLFVVSTMARKLDEIEHLTELRRGSSYSYSYRPATRTTYTRTYHAGGYSGYGYHSYGYSYGNYYSGGGGVYYGGGGFGCIFCIVLCILCCRGNQQDQGDGGYVTETVVVESYDVQ